MAADRFLTPTLSKQAHCENYTKVNPAIPVDMTAAERAESLCLVAPKRIAGPDHARLPDVSFSIGIAARRAGERYDDVARRANAAKHVVKKAGGGHWRVSLCQSA